VGPNLIALAIPAFFFFIGVELIVAHRLGAHVYRFADSLADLGCGIGQRAVLVLGGAAVLGLYALVYAKTRLFTFAPGSPWPWVIGILGVELGYYWWHRASHEVNFLWAVHVVHHQSEDYNLAVALRQAVLSPVTILPFYLPLALLGVPVLQFAVVESLVTLYQFWIHTELVGRIGPLEAVLNTPSHHRVHHAVNPQYLDRNYGGTFIVWDWLFGSFAPERAPCVYGVSHPLQSFNPAWAQVQPWVALLRDVARAPSLGQGLRLLFAKPEWRPDWLGPTGPLRGQPGTPEAKYDVRPGRRRMLYVFANFVLLIAATFSLVMWGGELALAWRIAGVGLILLTLTTLGGLLELRRWAPPLEAARWAAAVGLLAWAASQRAVV
jgi:sterol desaturase/sphingolipid hydroxylase (fatty acid hydroxylase superfamily)